MKDPTFWRDLRSQFASLDPSVAFCATVTDGELFDLTDGPNDPIQRASFLQRFKTFAARAGIAIGASSELAVDVWLQRLRLRTPQYFHEMTSWEIHRRAIPFGQIIPPSEDIERNREIDQLEETDRARRAEAELGIPVFQLPMITRRGEPEPLVSADDPVMRVEPLGDRYVVTAHRHLYQAIASRAEAVVECSVAIPSSGGWLDVPQQASVELCELLETDALASEVREVEAANAAELPDAESTLMTPFGLNITRLRGEAGWSLDDLQSATDIDKTLIIDHVKHGKGARPRTKLKYAKAFSKALDRHVTVEELDTLNTNPPNPTVTPPLRH